MKCLAAINRVRRGEAKTVSAAARAEGTTVRAIRTVVPGQKTDVILCPNRTAFNLVRCVVYYHSMC
jgi:hypothetical protein